VNGAGFSGPSVWSARAFDGAQLTTLERVTSVQELSGVASGVFVSTDSTAVIKMPAAIAGCSSSLDSSLDSGPQQRRVLHLWITFRGCRCLSGVSPHGRFTGNQKGQR
jgi:hypothetical protein